MATYRGNALNNSIKGSDEADKIYGAEGADELWGLDGNDWIYGGRDNDKMYGDDGHDHLYGEHGNDELHGGFGDDVLDGGEGNDSLYAGGGSNVLYGGEGNDRLSTSGNGAWLSDTRMYGGQGDDSYFFSRVSTTTLVDDAVPRAIEYADQGIDTIYLGSSFFNEMAQYQMPANIENLVARRIPAASLTGEPDEYVNVRGNGLNNWMVGTNEDDALHGGDGNDTLLSRSPEDVDVQRRDDGRYEDTMEGGNGNDRLEAIGSDRPDMAGGYGNDTYVLGDIGYAGTDFGLFNGWNIGESANAGIDTIITRTASTFLANHVEDMVYVGQSAHTHLWGNELDNNITGGVGASDEIRGYGGDDELDGGQGSGRDSLSGGNGNDVLRGHEDNDTLHGDAGNDELFGGRDHDQLHGGSGDDLLMGEVGDDTLLGEAGHDSLFGADGDDGMHGGSGNDSLSGGEGNDRLDGGADHDYLHGGSGNDWIAGDQGNDTLVGFWGDDQLSGGRGTDRMTGGGGKDFFIFDHVLDSTAIAGIDTITDFQQGLDRIVLSGIDANAYMAGDQAFVFRGTQGYQPGWNPGQLTVAYENGNTWVRADYTGDNQTDFELMLVGVVQLTAQDFVL